MPYDPDLVPPPPWSIVTHIYHAEWGRGVVQDAESEFLQVLVKWNDGTLNWVYPENLEVMVSSLVSPNESFDQLVPCATPGCGRMVSREADYCCASCRLAHQGEYEIPETGVLAHSRACNDKDYQRKEMAVV